MAITSIQKAKLIGKGIQEDMNTVIVEYEKMKQDIAISRASISQAQ